MRNAHARMGEVIHTHPTRRITKQLGGDMISKMQFERKEYMYHVLYVKRASYLVNAGYP
ncbi:unnamed protein product, partial [Dicrocoelium dendriticum]